jgi:peptidyl-dipeptidase A
MRKVFSETVLIQNKAAKENGYNDLSEFWISDFQDENFERNLKNLFDSIKPLYIQLHNFVRKKLTLYYGSKYKVSNPRLIPAHLLGLFIKS